MFKKICLLSFCKNISIFQKFTIVEFCRQMYALSAMCGTGILRCSCKVSPVAAICTQTGDMQLFIHNYTHMIPFLNITYILVFDEENVSTIKLTEFAAVN